MGFGIGKKLKDPIRDFFVNDIPFKFRHNIFFPHRYCISITDGSIVGKNCIIFHNVTLAAKNATAPKIGDNVIIYPNCVLLGGIEIGDNSIIGAGSIVTKSFPKGSIVAGNPAKLIRTVE